ncbi:unnamed protein product [Peronospora destructor]|uniref:Uncharacterized protein n=1 Tax=Peronospora destructor TaxID=86335 RepID=A0AAV0U9G7_9STRA|nr:unnamed protein product [Peronospora destructor]
MEVTPTLDNVRALRQLTLASEHFMICLCGVDVKQDTDTQVLQEAIQKIIRIKMQMGGYHQMSLAKAQGSRLVIEQEFTSDVSALVAAAPGVLSSADHDGTVDLDALFDDAIRYFRAQQDMERQAASSFRLLLIYRQVKQNPQLHIIHREIPSGFMNEPACHLDVIYWHQDVPLEAAQSVFDQLCLYDSTNPLAKFYFLDVGGSVERLHQALVLVLSHPTNRLSQNGAEQLLESWFSPAKESTH